MKQRENVRIKAHAKELALETLKDEVRLLTELVGADDATKGAKVVWVETLAIYTMELGMRAIAAT